MCINFNESLWKIVQNKLGRKIRAIIIFSERIIDQGKKVCGEGDKKILKIFTLYKYKYQWDSLKWIHAPLHDDRLFFFYLILFSDKIWITRFARKNYITCTEMNEWDRGHYTIKRLLNKLYECVNSKYMLKVEEWKGRWCLTSK